jgi:hypothetical protein
VPGARGRGHRVGGHRLSLRLGNHHGAEADLILGFRTWSKGPYDKLSWIAPRVRGHARNSCKGYTRMAAEILGKEERAAEFEDEYGRRLSGLRASLKGRTKGLRVSVLVPRGDGVAAAGGRAFSGEILADVGSPPTPRRFARRSFPSPTRRPWSTTRTTCWRALPIWTPSSGSRCSKATYCSPS